MEHIEQARKTVKFGEYFSLIIPILQFYDMI